MSRDRSGNGIQEVDGSIPFGSTNNPFAYLPSCDTKCLIRDFSPLSPLDFAIICDAFSDSNSGTPTFDSASSLQCFAHSTGERTPVISLRS